jgi:hypothetical protein
MTSTVNSCTRRTTGACELGKPRREAFVFPDQRLSRPVEEHRAASGQTDRCPEDARVQPVAALAAVEEMEPLQPAAAAVAPRLACALELAIFS